MSNCQNLIHILSSLLLVLVATVRADQISAPNSQYDGLEDFGPFIERLNFKVNYRVQSIVNGQPVAVVDLRESYHSSLATGLIKQTVYRSTPSEPWRLSRDQRKIFYDVETMRLVEFYRRSQNETLSSDQDELLRDDFFLYENGGSNGYANSQEDNASHRQWQQHSVRLIPISESLDALLLLAGLKTSLRLNFDDFMRPECLEVLKNKLYYVNGLTRLLLMIECRRQDLKFKDEVTPQGAKRDPAQTMTRGMSHLLYVAPKLQALKGTAAAIEQMDISVTISQSGSGRNQAMPSDILPANRVPLSVVLNFAHEEDVLLIVNVFQFETLDVLQHVSESSSDAGHSSYLLPLNQIDLNHLRSTARGQQTLLETQMDKQKVRKRDRFSFRATMTMSRGERGQLLSDPIEMVVLYDGRAALLATQMEFVDRTKSSASAGWHRDQVRTLYDGQSNTKYHLMRTNFNYNNLDELGQQRELPLDSDPFRWRACATDVLTTRELSLIERAADDLFDLTTGASFMGTALVRGLLCHVFERRLNALPELLGLTMDDYVHLRAFSISEIYAQIYVAAARHDKHQFDVQQITNDAASGKFVRLDVRLVGRVSGEMASFRLEIHSFDWSTHLLKDVPDLLDVGQTCLASDFAARHAELQLSLELDRAKLRNSQLSKHQTEAIVALSRDAALLQTAFSELLVHSLGISTGQQLDLDVQLAEISVKQALGKQLQLLAKLTVYDKPREGLVEQLIGYGQDLSSRLFKLSSLSLAPNLGARVYSYDECRWRAAHSLIPGEMSSAEDDSSSSRIFMFCPESQLCVLGDSSWRRVQTERELTIDGLFKFPYPSDETLPAEASDRCAFYAVSLRDRELFASWKSHADQFKLGARSHLDWLEWHRSHDFRDIRDQTLELKVEVTSGDTVSLPLVAKQVKLSRTFESARQPDGQASLLTRPLPGVGYAASEREPTTPLASNNDGPQSVMEPLLAINLAECGRNCLLLHNCNSYSACHAANGRLACLFSSLAWSRPAEFERLRSLARTKRSSTPSGASQTGQAQIELQLGEGESARKVQVQLRRSKLCSLHARPHVDLFKPEPFKLSGQRPHISFIMPVSSLERCARLCQERAHLARQLATLEATPNSSTSSKKEPISEPQQASSVGWPSKWLTEFRAFTCHGFHYSALSGSCSLLPLLNHWSLLGLEHLIANKTQAEQQLVPVPANFETIERWRTQLLQQTRIQDWIKQDRSNHRPADHFELDFEQLFLAQRNRRLKLEESCEQGAACKLQLKIWHMDLRYCAKRCINLIGCRSFDFLQPTDRHESSRNGVESVLQTLCVLNTVSATDLAVAPQSWPKFAFVSEPANNSSVWWHYEPNELALFMLIEPRETDAAALAQAGELPRSDRAEDDRDPILLRPPDNKLSDFFTAQTSGSG